jgi:hypothetical protein
MTNQTVQYIILGKEKELFIHSKPFITMRFLLISCFVFFTVCSHTQTIEKVVFNPSNPLMGYYLQVQPLSGQIDQVLLLLPGFSQRPESIFTESQLPYVASANNILTLAVAGGPTLFANDFPIQNLHQMLAKVQEEYPEIAQKTWVIGGFSAGGSIALRYVEFCNEKEGNCPIDFKAVFAVDSPVDVIDFWKYMEREIERNASEIGVNEAKFVTNIFLQQEGKPSENAERYAYLTAIDVSKKQSNEVYLKDVAVRTYHDIDIAWVIEERQRSAFDTNFLNASELIKRLRALGNERAEFIQSDQKGYRSNGMRHPHSWSIVDEVECIQWIKTIK